MTSRSVCRSKASNLLFGARTYETTQAPWSSESRHPSRGGGGTKVLVVSGRNEERLQPLLVLGVDDIGCSESREEGNTRTPLQRVKPMNGTRVLHSGITGPCCSTKQFVGLPSFPSKPDHRPCSRHRKVRHVAREGRCGEERQTAWLFSSSGSQGLEQSKRGQGRQPRMGEDRRLTGVPACRNRVAEIGSRSRGSEKLEDGPLLNQTAVDVVLRVGGS